MYYDAEKKTILWEKDLFSCYANKFTYDFIFPHFKIDVYGEI